MNAEMIPSGSPETTGAMIAELVRIRDRKRELEAELKDLNEQWEGLKSKVLYKMEQEGSNRISSKDGGMVILSEIVVPQIVDWDAFETYVQESGNLYLLQRRVATKAYRELVEAGQEVPGIQPFVKKDINLRS
jgi:hypothetical protein